MRFLIRTPIDTIIIIIIILHLLLLFLWLPYPSRITASRAALLQLSL
jgi:hypothetical protein